MNVIIISLNAIDGLHTAFDKPDEIFFTCIGVILASVNIFSFKLHGGFCYLYLQTIVQTFSCSALINFIIILIYDLTPPQAGIETILIF